MFSLYRLKQVIIGCLITVCAITAGRVITRRWQFEAQDRRVEMTIGFSDVKRLVLLSGQPLKVVLKRLKKDAKIQSISVEEETISGLVDQGKVSVLKGSEISSLYRFGSLNRSVLNQLYSRRRRPNPDSFYLITDHKADYERLKRYCLLTFGSRGVKQIDRWNILEIIDERDDLLRVGVGFSTKDIASIQAIGLSVILRPRNTHRKLSNLVRESMRDIKRVEGIHTLIFSGPSVLGYPTQLSELASYVNDFNIGIIEFSKQVGMSQLLKDVGVNRVLRVHTIPERELMSLKYAQQRYVRAVKERGAHILLLNPFFKGYFDHTLLDYNIKFFASIHDQLASYGFKLATIGTVKWDDYQPIRPWEFMVMGIAVGLSVLWFLLRICRLSLWWQIGMVTGPIVLSYMALAYGWTSEWSRVEALIIAILFPVIAILSQFPEAPLGDNHESTTASMLKRSLSTVGYLLRTVMITMIGVGIIITLLSDMPYLLGLQSYYGVKLSFLLPLLIVGLFFYIRPHRLAAMLYVFRRLMYAPIQTISLLGVFCCSIVVVIYILRSGNMVSFSVPFFELSIRSFLEDQLFVRPRTKEFLVGYPFLMMAYYCVDRSLLRGAMWFFNTLGVVALVSVINSFCHFHTPLLISLYRTGLGIACGMIMALIYVLIFRTGQGLVRRYIR